MQNLPNIIYGTAWKKEATSNLVYEAIKNGFKAIGLAKNVALYEYKNTYYLCLSQINLAYPDLKKLFSCIPEFASFVSHSDVFIRKFSETGNLIIKHNAILTSLKHFSK